MKTEEVSLYQRDAIVMANARRLVRKKSMPNARLYMEIFGTGMQTAVGQCVGHLGLDPDSKETSYLKMMGHIDRIAQ